MKAMVYRRYGPPDVLRLEELEKPVPKDNEVLIRIHATTVAKGDCEMRSPKIPNMIWFMVRIILFGLIKPKNKVLGGYLAGEVEAVGTDVTLFKPGDPVFACSGIHLSAYAEYICLPEGEVAIKPTNMTFEEASAVPLGMDPLHFLRKAHIQKSDKVLVNGASGSMGIFAIQLAKHFGAEVTAVDSGKKLEMARSLGADHVIDYTQKDFSADGETYDVIFDVICKRMFSRSIRALKPNGRYLLVNPGGLFQMLRGMWISRVSSKKVILEFASYTVEDLIFLRDLIEAGEMRSIIEKCYPLEQVADAHRYIEAGHKQGNIVITMRKQ